MTADVIIPPTYEVCGGIYFLLFRPFVHTYIRLLVNTFICSYIRSFVRLSVTGSKFLR